MSELDFKRMKREEGSTVQKHLYVTYGSACQCDCSFCRNHCFEKEKMKDSDQLNKALIESEDYFRNITFGGGEPLIYIDEIMDVIHEIIYKEEQEKGIDEWEDELNFTLVTNGYRRLFLKKIGNRCPYCKKFRQIILSRHHYDDQKNEEIFRTKKRLLDTEDLEDLCEGIKRKMLLSCLCQRGGIDSIEELMFFISWAKGVGINNIMFSNFQEEVTEQEELCKQLPKDFFQEAQFVLEHFLQFEKESQIVFSAGYVITTYKLEIDAPEFVRFMLQDEYPTIKISFKEYLSVAEIKKLWDRATRRTYNYSAMPDGTLYQDWICKVKL